MDDPVAPPTAPPQIESSGSSEWAVSIIVSCMESLLKTDDFDGPDVMNDGDEMNELYIIICDLI